MKVPLYVPPGGYFAERYSSDSMLPALGLDYMAAVLEKKGVDIEIVPSHVLGLTWDDIAKKIANETPDIVGATTTTENRHLSFDLLRLAKKAYPRAFTVIGGPHLNGTARDTLDHIPDIDGAIVGEGERTICELVDALDAKEADLHNIAGLAWRRDGVLVENGLRALIPDLNDLPMPARHLEPMERYRFHADVPGKGRLLCGNIMTSRGCPFTCTFCATPGNWGSHVRGRSPENVIREMELLRDTYGVRVIWFYDDTFNHNRKRTFDICALMKERKVGLPWYCEVRVDVTTKEMLAAMADAGCYYIGFGIESGSERICRDIITKRATIKQAYDVIEWCHELGIVPNPFFIFSHPTETWEEAMQTAAILEDLKPHCDTSAAIMHIYPGTQIEKRARSEGKIPDDFSWTTPHDKRLIMLTAAQGHAPLYVDKLTWWQISELIMRFAMGHKRHSLAKKIPKVLKSINSFKDFELYSILFLVMMKHKILRWLGLKPKVPSSGRRVPNADSHDSQSGPGCPA